LIKLLDQLQAYPCTITIISPTLAEGSDISITVAHFQHRLARSARSNRGFSMRESRWGTRSFTVPLRSAAFALTTAGSVAAAALLASAPSFAQTADQTAQAAPTEPVETIQVTGTRIRSANVEAAAPVISVSAEELKLEGTSNVETLLNNLPQVAADQTQGQSNGGTGTATVSLRNLGANRTLVLIDGKRLGPGDASGGTGAAADLNFIPATLVQSVEVLTGGASTDYGSDALAGVVNFKMKRDFEGIEIDQQVGTYQHDQQNGLAQGLLGADGLATPGNQLGGTNYTSTIIAGANGANGKSNITMYMTDAHTDAVLQGSRDFSACEIENTAESSAGKTPLECGGSVNSPQGLFFSNVTPGANGAFPAGPGQASVAGGGEFTTNPNGTASIVPGSVNFNFNPLNFLQRDDQRYTGGAFTHYQVAPWMDLYADFGFLDDKTTAQIAPGGLFAGSGPTGTVNVNCTNPFLGAQQALAFGCGDPTFVGTNGAGPGQVAILTPGLRFAGIPRQDILEHTDYRFVVGSRGDLPYGFNYDLSVSYWNSGYSDETSGFASFTKVQDALLVTTNAAGQPVCISGNAGCVPLNIFSRNGAVAAENSVLTNSLIIGSTTEVVAQNTISGDLGRFGVISPLAKDPVSVAVGFEYRFENIVKTPDEENQTGDLLGGAGDVLPVNGSYDDQDFFGEVHVPVVQDLPFAKSVDLDLGLRHSGYQVYGTDQTYDTNTYKIQGDWQIVNDVKLRGGYNRAARAPNTFELFDENTVALTSGFDDPCSGPTPAASLAACERTGVTAAQYGHIADCPAAQCSELVGGNLQVKPEEADTYTWGIVYTPTYLRNFAFTMDYFTISIADAISDGGIAPNISLDQCIAAASPLCANIHRGPGGIIFGQQAFITATTQNAGNESTNGLDFTTNYKHDLDFIGAGDLGTVSVNFIGTWTGSLDTTPFPGSGSFNCAGLFGITCGEPDPSWRHQLRTTWITPWDANISLNWRHLSGVSFDGNSSNPILNGGAFNTTTEGISSYDYFDLATTYQVRSNLELRAGINNLFDRDPPIVNANIAGPGAFGNGNTYPGVYDALGREFFFGATMKF
jgi:iron complex outermembrane recepter protein